MMTVETRIDALEINGVEVSGIYKKEDQLSIQAHWNRKHLVVIEFQGRHLTVSAEELLTGIYAATYRR